jgi:hypothetical protein
MDLQAAISHSLLCNAKVSIQDVKHEEIVQQQDLGSLQDKRIWTTTPEHATNDDIPVLEEIMIHNCEVTLTVNVISTDTLNFILITSQPI